MARTKRKELNILVRLDGKIPAAAYLRVSSAGQDVGNSIDAQLEHIRRWADSNGYVIVKVFTDSAKSGMFADRPDFQEMVDMAESDNCPFSVILVWRFSRFFRDRVESTVYKQRLRNRNIRVTSINEPTDDTPQGQLTEGFFELLDQYNSEMTALEVRRGTHNLAGRGFFVGGITPTGMKKIQVLDKQGDKVTERNKLAPDENAWMIRRMFDLSLQDKSDSAIEHTLRAEGIIRPTGQSWPANRIHEVLTNPHYEGTIAWGEIAGYLKEEGTWEPRTWKTICEGAHEGIVTPEEFAEVKRLRKERGPEVSHPRHVGSEHTLSGLGKCRQCGAPYTYRPAGSKGKNYEYIICTTRKNLGPEYCDSPLLPAAAFEAMTLDVVNEDILLRPNLELAMEQLRKNSGALHSDKHKRVDRIRERIADLDRRIEKAYFAWENDEDMAYEFFQKRTNELRKLKAESMEELKKAEENLDETFVILNNPEAVFNYATQIKTFLRDEKPASARKWLKTFLKAVWIEPGFVTYEYGLPLPRGSANAGQKKHRVSLDKELDPITRSGPRKRESKGHWQELRICQLRDSRFPKLTNEVQHQVKVLSWEQNIGISPLKSGVKWPVYAPRDTRSAKSRQVWIARHLPSHES